MTSVVSSQVDQDEAPGGDRKILVGCAFMPKKMETMSRFVKAMESGQQGEGGARGGLGSINWKEEDGATLMVEFRQLDLSRDISEQGEFDVILHKLSEDIMFRSRRTKSDERLRRLEKYSSMANPHRCAITDPFCSVAKVINRVTAMDTLKAVYQTLGKSACVPQPPHYIVVEAGSSPQSIRDQTRRARLRYPLICKPIEACGSPGSHNMLVVLDECSLSVITAPTVVQEFRNHRARLFKVCVLGDVVRVYERPSLPDLSNDLAGHLEFDSQKPYPTLKDFGGTGNGAEPGEQAASDCSLPEGFALVAAERLREAFGLSLFGFDLIVDSASGEVLCIDVNYFPSFKDLEDFPMLLLHHLCASAR